jgi:transcriptional regulator with XRE-family HTH domain
VSSPAQLGELLVEHRKAAGLSQRTLAERAGLMQATVSHLETGRTSPTLHTIERYASALGLEIDIRVHPARPKA